MVRKSILTGEDGTQYWLREDGAVARLDETGAPGESCPTWAGERPLRWSELRDRQAVEGGCEVPKKLRKLWSDLSIETPAELRGVARRTGDRPALVSGHRPDWVGTSIRPRAAARAARPRVTHRGVELTPLIVWNSDDRRTYHDTRYPWGCICRILTDRGHGSGVLVGPRHVLTANHVVNWERRRATVEVHRSGAYASATARVIAAWHYTEIGGGAVGHDEVDEDYAVLITDQRLGDRFGWMGTRVYNSDWDDEDYWFNIGYPDDIAGGSAPIWQRRKSLDEDELDFGSARAMTTTADTVKGQSGGPMFAFWGDGLAYAVAVVSAEGSYALSGSENWCSGGPDLTSLVLDARAGDP